VLSCAESEISRERPLAELGLDSLLMLEFVTKLERSTGVRASLTGSSANRSVSGLADEIVGLVKTASFDDRDRTVELAERHLDALKPGDVTYLSTLVQGQSRRVGTTR
jgi:acyl carrier protein